MQESELRKAVYEKLQAEYNSFIEYIKTLPSEQIILCSYEKIIKEEMVEMFYPEAEKYDVQQIKALNKTKYPLEELYQGWMDSDIGLNQILEDNVHDTLEELVKEQKNKKKDMER